MPLISFKLDIVVFFLSSHSCVFLTLLQLHAVHLFTLLEPPRAAIRPEAPQRLRDWWWGGDSVSHQSSSPATMAASLKRRLDPVLTAARLDLAAAKNESPHTSLLSPPHMSTAWPGVEATPAQPGGRVTPPPSAGRGDPGPSPPTHTQTPLHSSSPTATSSTGQGAAPPQSPSQPPSPVWLSACQCQAQCSTSFTPRAHPSPQ